MTRDCPNWTEIYVENAGFENSIATDSYFPEAAALAVLKVRPEAAEILGETEKLAEDIRLEHQNILSRMIDDRAKMAAELTCKKCTGVVINRSDGKLYCGLEVPESVIETNRRMEG